MKETETIDEFAGKLSALSSKFSTLGATLEDSSLVKKLLDSVPDKFFPIVVGIEQFYDLESIPFEEAIGRLKAYEERTLRLRSNTNDTEGELLLTHAEWQMRQKGSNVDTSSGGKGCGSSSPSRGKWRGRGRGRGHGRGTQRQDNAGGTSGNNSGTRDKRHIKCFNCEKMGHYASECYNKRRDDEAHLTCATDEEPALMMTVSHEESDTRRERQDTILLSEDRLLPEMYRGVKKEDKDVWYLDNETGNEVHMEKDIMKVIDRSGKLLMRVKRTQNRLYKLLGEKKLAVDVPPLPQPNKLCEVCVVAKHARSPFPHQANFRATKPLELLHADIYGPISPSTLAAKKDVFQAFKKFKSVTENTTEYKIKTLRIDRGGEFLSTEFTRFCENEGIERHLTAPYTPQQNGVVERHNRTVMAMARSLLKGTHMPARFWGEAVRHTVYLLNRLPTKVLGGRTPFEAWMGRKPHLAHLRVFGCVAYVKNATPHLKKLDDRSSPMVYLGVEEGCKAHRLFDPRHGKLQVSRDVVFQENSEWTWTAGANHEENLPEFMVEDALDTDEVIVVVDIEAGTEDVAPPTTAVVPMTRASSPSTSSSSTHTTTSPDSHEGPVRFRSIADIYANTEEVVGIDEEENEEMLMMSEEPTYYQE
ncbi:uncharacterized protein LOC121986987 [Zingiber officinale]|nr:uncharacterized protein LOC121986987 [Zingiber officinale]